MSVVVVTQAPVHDARAAAAAAVAAGQALSVDVTGTEAVVYAAALRHLQTSAVDAHHAGLRYAISNLGQERVLVVDGSSGWRPHRKCRPHKLVAADDTNELDPAAAAVVVGNRS